MANWNDNTLKIKGKKKLINEFVKSDDIKKIAHYELTQKGNTFSFKSKNSVPVDEIEKVSKEYPKLTFVLDFSFESEWQLNSRRVKIKNGDRKFTPIISDELKNLDKPDQKFFALEVLKYYSNYVKYDYDLENLKQELKAASEDDVADIKEKIDRTSFLKYLSLVAITTTQEDFNIQTHKIFKLDAKATEEGVELPF